MTPCATSSRDRPPAPAPVATGARTSTRSPRSTPTRRSCAGSRRTGRSTPAESAELLDRLRPPLGRARLRAVGARPARGRARAASASPGSRSRRSCPRCCRRSRSAGGWRRRGGGAASRPRPRARASTSASSASACGRSSRSSTSATTRSLRLAGTARDGRVVRRVPGHPRPYRQLPRSRTCGAVRACGEAVIAALRPAVRRQPRGVAVVRRRGGSATLRDRSRALAAIAEARGARRAALCAPGGRG